MSIIRSVRITTGLVIGALLAFGALSASAVAAPGTIRVLDFGSPSLGYSIPIAAPGGGTFSTDPGRALVRVTPGTGAASQVTAWCVDPTRIISQGVDYPVSLQTPADTPELSTPGFQEAGWLIGASDGLIAKAPDQGFEAAAIQIALWQLAGKAADVAAVTTNPTLNTRVAQLRALADGKVLVTALALAGPTGAVAVGSPATLTLTGTPGAVVDLAVTSGSATLSSTQTTLGPSGTAQVTVTPAATGGVVVSASAQGGALVRAAHPSGRSVPQDMAFVTPVPLSATATLTAIAPAVAPVVTPLAPATAPSVRVAQLPARLALAKSAPGTVLRGSVIDYRLTVTNVSARTARAVIVRDPVPAGTFLGHLPRSARLRSGAVVWHLGTLAPGASVTVRLRLRTSVSAVGDVLNVASASASNAATVRARARTLLVAPRRVAPAVVVPRVTG